MTCSTRSDQYETLGRLYDDPEERVSVLSAIRPDETTVDRQRAVFGALANGSRLRLLAALRDGEKCACELEIVLDAPQSTVATHLRKLRTAGLIKRRRKGKWSHYRLADGAVIDLLDLAADLGVTD